MCILFLLDILFLFQSGTTHLVFFVSPGPLPGIMDVNVRELKPEIQRVQLLKSQLPDPEFPKDTYTFTMNVKNVCF